MTPNPTDSTPSQGEALAALNEVRDDACRCHPDYKRRSKLDPNCNHDTAPYVATLERFIATHPDTTPPIPKGWRLVPEVEIIEVVAILEEDRAIHVRWAEWQESDPEWRSRAKSDDVGGPEHHRLWEARYTKVLDVVRRLAAPPPPEADTPPAGEGVKMPRELAPDDAAPNALYLTTSHRRAYIHGYNDCRGEVLRLNPAPADVDAAREQWRKAYEPDDYEDAFKPTTPAQVDAAWREGDSLAGISLHANYRRGAELVEALRKELPRSKMTHAFTYSRDELIDILAHFDTSPTPELVSAEDELTHHTPMPYDEAEQVDAAIHEGIEVVPEFHPSAEPWSDEAVERAFVTYHHLGRKCKSGIAYDGFWPVAPTEYGRERMRAALQSTGVLARQLALESKLASLRAELSVCQDRAELAENEANAHNIAATQYEKDIIDLRSELAKAANVAPAAAVMVEAVACIVISADEGNAYGKNAYVSYDESCMDLSIGRHHLYTATAIQSAVMAEREACAKVCEAERVDEEDTGAEPDFAYNVALRHAAAAIRAHRGEKT